MRKRFGIVVVLICALLSNSFSIAVGETAWAATSLGSRTQGGDSAESLEVEEVVWAPLVAEGLFGWMSRIAVEALIGAGALYLAGKIFKYLQEARAQGKSSAVIYSCAEGYYVPTEASMRCQNGNKPKLVRVRWAE